MRRYSQRPRSRLGDKGVREGEEGRDWGVCKAMTEERRGMRREEGLVSETVHQERDRGRHCRWTIPGTVLIQSTCEVDRGENLGGTCMVHC